jgi:hypothetical protein
VDARDELRLRVAAASRLIRASDTREPCERDRLVRSARAIIHAANGRLRFAAEHDGRGFLTLYLERDAVDEDGGDHERAA